MAKRDILLRELNQAFANADEELGPFLRCTIPGVEDIVRRLLLLQWRARDAFQDFADFYTIRLLLDEDSVLASYFIDIFVELHWMLTLLKAYNVSRTWVESLENLLSPAAEACRLLYVADRMFQCPQRPFSMAFQQVEQRGQSGRRGCMFSTHFEEFKRAGRRGRMFSSNMLHCRMRQLGFVNLDQQGQSLVSLKEELGRGSYGTVYRGVFEADDGVEKNEKIIIGEPVAVKMFTHGGRSESGTSFSTQLLHSMEEASQLLSTDSQSSINGEIYEIVENAQLATELSRLVSVRHPNIVTPRGYIGKRPQGESGLVMELMDESLHEFLRKVKGGDLPPLSEHDMLDLMLEIAKGMRFLHECNLMHRDLKPGNVLLRYAKDHRLGQKRLEVKLADFGVTKLYGFSSSAHTAPAGSNCYMAPELKWGNCCRQKVFYEEEKADVFSYGTTCFNILIGNPNAMAFVNPDAVPSPPSYKAFYEAVKTGRWMHWVRGIDKSLDYMVKLVARCWETDPSKRPTFATVCILLQHSFQCLVQKSSAFASSFCESLSFPFNCNHVGRLQKLASSFNRYHYRCCKSILWQIQERHQTVGIDETQRVMAFFGAETVNAIERGLIFYTKFSVSDFVKDFGMYLKAQENICAKRLAFPWPKMVTKKPPKIEFEKGADLCMMPLKDGLIDNCLKTSDPLLLLRGLVNYFIIDTYYSRYGHRKTFPSYQKFDFRNDDAHTDLKVDKTLMPLLVGFWSLKIPHKVPRDGFLELEDL